MNNCKFLSAAPAYFADVEQIKIKIIKKNTAENEIYID